jgi:hypothetical protein
MCIAATIPLTLRLQLVNILGVGVVFSVSHCFVIYRGCHNALYLLCVSGSKSTKLFIKAELIGHTDYDGMCFVYAIHICSVV